MFGALISTPLSDKFGRKPIFLLSQWAMVVVGVANAFAPNYYAFIVLRFFTGMLFYVRILSFELLLTIRFVDKHWELALTAAKRSLHAAAKNLTHKM